MPYVLCVCPCPVSQVDAVEDTSIVRIAGTAKGQHTEWLSQVCHVNQCAAFECACVCARTPACMLAPLCVCMCVCVCAYASVYMMYVCICACVCGSLRQVREIRIPASEATGPCKARYLATQLWEGEKYYLQIDAHMR